MLINTILPVPGQSAPPSQTTPPAEQTTPADENQNAPPPPANKSDTDNTANRPAASAPPETKADDRGQSAPQSFEPRQAKSVSSDVPAVAAPETSKSVVESQMLSEDQQVARARAEAEAVQQQLRTDAIVARISDTPDVPDIANDAAVQKEEARKTEMTEQAVAQTREIDQQQQDMKSEKMRITL